MKRQIIDLRFLLRFTFSSYLFAPQILMRSWQSQKHLRSYLNTLKAPKFYTAEIKLFLALDHERPKISETVKSPSINVSLILEVVIELFPVDEFELLSEINEFLIAGSQGVDE